MATIDNVRGVYRSTDAGASGVRINDDLHQYGNAGEAITGDYGVFGRVYLGTNGRGVLVADPTGGPTTTTTTRPGTTTTRPATTTTTRPATTTTTRPATTTTRPATTTTRPATTTTSQPSGGCSATYTQIGQWGGAFQGEVRVTNTGTSTTTGWTVVMTFANGQTVTQIWGGRTTSTANPYTVLNETWNNALGPNASTTFGFLANWNNTTNNAPALTCSRTP